MAWRRRRRPANRQRGEPAADDLLLAETIAQHFQPASLDGTTVQLPSLGLEIACNVFDRRTTGAIASAHLGLTLGGRGLSGAARTSISGYGDDHREAIVEGACAWAATFGPTLRVAFGREPASPDVGVVDVEVRGRPMRLVVSRLDRTIGALAPAAKIDALRRAIGAEPWMAPTLVDSRVLPLLPEAPSVLGVFVGQAPGLATTEVKVNGGDWLPAADHLEHMTPPSAAEDAPATVFLRELAVLLPLADAPPLTRSDVAETLAGLSSRNERRRLAAWPGWETHGGRLGDPMSEEDLSQIEARAGRLPEDHRRFLLDVAACGAGPGYGLLRPVVDGIHITLAEAGCNVRWQLRLDASHRGSVWVHAPGSDQRYEQVATSFTEWYRTWLDANVRGAEPWVQWDARHCATPNVLARALDARERETGHRPSDLSDVVPPPVMTLTAGVGWGASVIDPCESCVALVAACGLGPDVFAPGVFRRPPHA